MDNLLDLLNIKDFHEPEESKVIKKYIYKKYAEVSTIKIETNQITIIVGNSSLASSLRMDIPEIQGLTNSSKKIAIFIN